MSFCLIGIFRPTNCRSVRQLILRSFCFDLHFPGIGIWTSLGREWMDMGLPGGKSRIEQHLYYLHTTMDRCQLKNEMQSFWAFNVQVLSRELVHIKLEYIKMLTIQHFTSFPHFLLNLPNSSLFFLQPSAAQYSSRQPPCKIHIKCFPKLCFLPWYHVKKEYFVKKSVG